MTWYVEPFLLNVDRMQDKYFVELMSPEEEVPMDDVNDVIPDPMLSKRLKGFIPS